jgi:excisionase family DNA binding protein
MTGSVTDDCATLSARQAALRAGVDEREMRRRIERGEVVAVKSGRTWRIRVSDLEAAGLTVHDEVGELARRAESAEQRVVELEAELEQLRARVSELQARPAPPPRRGRFGIRRQQPEYDWRVIGGLIETETQTE